jgi:lipopolysaccharide export system protein LptA
MSTERIYLKGKAVIEQLGSTLKSESIRYDMVQGKIDAGAGETSGRVVMQLDPTRVRKTDDTDD